MTNPGDDQSSGTMKLFPDLGLCICESMNKISLLVLFWYQEFACFALSVCHEKVTNFFGATIILASGNFLLFLKKISKFFIS